MAQMAQMACFTQLKCHLRQKWLIFGFPDLQFHRQRSQMLVSHFDANRNGVKTVCKPKPNSFGTPHNTLAHKCVLSRDFPCSIWAQVWSRVQGQRGLITWPRGEIDPHSQADFHSPYNTQQLCCFVFGPTLPLKKVATQPPDWCTPPKKGRTNTYVPSGVQSCPKEFVRFLPINIRTPPLLGAGQRFWDPTITFHRGKVGANTNWPSCWVLYGEQKWHWEWGSISPPAGDIGPPLSWTWVWNGAQNRLEKRRIWTVGGVVRCMGFLESWVLVSIWVSSHYDMYRNGILTFGPSSWGTGDLGTRNLVTLAVMTILKGKTHHLT